jgi:hypothetical protein
MLESETHIDRANLADACNYLEEIAKNNSKQKEWKYIFQKSVSYVTQNDGYWHNYKIEAVPDRILCAAVHFPKSFTYSNRSENVEAQKPVGIQSGIVVTGRRHSDCLSVYLALTGGADIKDSVDGFLTVSNRFVDRADAFQIARIAGQLLSHVDENGDLLTSEMLYFD